MSLLVPFIFFIALIFVIGAFMYIVIMGPSPYHRNGRVGTAYRLLRRVPVMCGGICCSVRFKGNQEKGRAACKSCCDHATQERNWYMVVFYVALVWTVEVLYLFFSLPALRASWLSKGVSWGLVLLSEYLYVQAIIRDPGKITPRGELKEQQAYTQRRIEAAAARGRSTKKAPRGPKGKGPGRAGAAAAAAAGRDPPRWPKWHLTTAEEYVLNRRHCVDGMLYALASDEAMAEHSTAENEFRNPAGCTVGLGQMCSSCNVVRHARSKHCRMCKMCVRRFDHHCPWINNDVAEGTHRFFLGFLFTHGISCTWACSDLFRCIKQYLVDRRAWGWVLRGPGGKLFPLRFADYLAIVVNYCMLDACLLFFAFCISLVLYGFWAYQMSFVVANLTMNDLGKLEDVAQFVSDLPTLTIVVHEARRVFTRLDSVALRKPTALRKLQPPPEDFETNPEWAEGGKKNRAYRKKVRSMVMYDLKGLYDRGVWENLKEVFFPYAVLTPQRVEEATKVAPRVA